MPRAWPRSSPPAPPGRGWPRPRSTPRAWGGRAPAAGGCQPRLQGVRGLCRHTPFPLPVCSAPRHRRQPTRLPLPTSAAARGDSPLPRGGRQSQSALGQRARGARGPARLAASHAHTAAGGIRSDTTATATAAPGAVKPRRCHPGGCPGVAGRRVPAGSHLGSSVLPRSTPRLQQDRPLHPPGHMHSPTAPCGAAPSRAALCRAEPSRAGRRRCRRGAAPGAPAPLSRAARSAAPGAEEGGSGSATAPAQPGPPKRFSHLLPGKSRKVAFRAAQPQSATPGCLPLVAPRAGSGGLRDADGEEADGDWTPRNGFW